MGFAVTDHPNLVQFRAQPVIMLSLHQLLLRPTKIPQETITHFRAVHDIARQRGKIWHRIIAAQSSELLQHCGRPVGRSRFPAVEYHVADAGLPQSATTRLAIFVEILGDIAGDVRATQLIDLQSRSARLSRCVMLSRKRITKAQHNPLTARRGPVEGTIGPQLTRQIDDIGSPQGASLGRCRQCVIIMRNLKSRLAFPGVDHRCAVKHKLRNQQSTCGAPADVQHCVLFRCFLNSCRNYDPEHAGRGRGHRSRPLRPRSFQPTHHFPGSAVITCFQPRVRTKPRAARPTHRRIISGRDRNRPDRHRLTIIILQPGVAFRRARCQLAGSNHIAIVQGGGVEAAAAGRCDRARQDILRGQTECDYLCIPIKGCAVSRVDTSVVLEQASGTRRLRQFAREALATVDPCLAPDIFLHCLFGLDPGAAAFAPAGGTGDADIKISRDAAVDRVLEGILPFGTHICQRRFQNPRRTHVHVKRLISTQPDTLHPGQIGVDPLLADLPAVPVPPHPRLGRGRGGLERVERNVFSSYAARI